ncbi:hypothetical protein C1645_822533 [Glomus cerebriforme]|uniref:Uncharacterized protein n=1 Tax=Glomus cerebriforme TaxID=658196 RepID=A0A397SZM7_9GLOM|nr:hypothetical protein C1645_822533 [Glomus cerebriforme]
MTAIRQEFVTAAPNWIDGCYNEWDSGEKQLKDQEQYKQYLKNWDVNRSLFNEAKLHLTLVLVSGQSPFINYEYNYDLAKIVNGMRPKLIGTIKKTDKNIVLEDIEKLFMVLTTITFKLCQFENLPEPRNATKASNPYDFNISDDKDQDELGLSVGIKHITKI